MKSEYLSLINKKIIYFFLLLLVISGVYYYFSDNRMLDCSEANFIIKKNNNAVGEYISFEDVSNGATSWEWNFGDSTKMETKSTIYHMYKKPGIYTVKLKINKKCIIEKRIEILDKGELVDRMKIPRIVSPHKVTVGDIIHFSYHFDDNVFSSEWSFGETGRVDKVDESPSYVFSTPGVKKISLILNGDIQHMVTKDIYVRQQRILPKENSDLTAYIPKRQEVEFELPPGELQEDPLVELLAYVPGVPTKKIDTTTVFIPKEKRAPELSKAQLSGLIRGVASGNKSIDDFIPYLSNGLSTPVIKNRKKMMTLEDFCTSLEGKKIRIESLQLSKNKLGYIENITIKYKVKSMLIWMYD